MQFLTVVLNSMLSSTVLNVGPFRACILRDCWDTIVGTKHKPNVLNASVKSLCWPKEIYTKLHETWQSLAAIGILKFLAASWSCSAQECCLRDKTDSFRQVSQTF